MAEKKITSIGGQAVIEGVMMRGPHKIAIAVRKPDGEIIIDEKDINNKTKWIAKVPILRGVWSFFSSMIIGVQALMFSAKFYDIDDGTPLDNKEQAINSKEDNSKKDSKKTSKKKDSNEMPEWMLYISVLVSLVISVSLFFVLPNFITNFVVQDKVAHPILYNFIESIIKLLIFGGYMVLVSHMKDIQRVFQYHGAEHKSIFCYENGEELTVENVKKYTRFHPRCGTSFLLFVIIISIIVFSLLGVYENVFINIGLRLLFLPIVAGLSYEVIKFAGRSTNKCITWLNEPGKWLQRLTTREPDDSQIEVAIASLKAVIPENKDDDRW